ncbi:TPA: hypothetical protein L4942_006652 [Pseudomonas aeruginosa]|nr:MULTISPECIES: hypothetical protein [Gammaproteobacteria]EKW0332668.1 hypothetical protein [Pseudomonas aeruginosa]EKW2710875.1 hypothetical protein [Pseudomonas aeruginosa]EKW3864643.1 hypothetical protein [Pseudomonas aeruginosa]EKW3864776.1 hypothetical protein [Pseudomonas aeruginosa]MBC9044769.1 hypothetical protein [Pseudomonas aeruginosa]
MRHLFASIARPGHRNTPDLRQHGLVLRADPAGMVGIDYHMAFETVAPHV